MFNRTEKEVVTVILIAIIIIINIIYKTSDAQYTCSPPTRIQGYNVPNLRLQSH